MGDPHRTVSGVHALASGAGRPEHIDLQVLRLDLDVDFLGLGEHRYSGGGGVNSSLRLGRRYSLHSVDPGFPAQKPVSFIPPYGNDCLFDASQQTITYRDRIPLETMALAEALVHAVEIGSKQGSFITAGARPDL